MYICIVKQLNIKQMKFTSNKTFASLRKDCYTVQFFADDILICTYRKSKEMYCTIKHGSPSNIRDKSKVAHYVSWNSDGLKTVTGINEIKVGGRGDCDFYNSYPDTTWGDTGNSISLKRVKELVIGFINSKK